MSFVFTDRESAYPNRYLVTKENGATEHVVLERADEPVVPGTPLNAETFNAMIAELLDTAGLPGLKTAEVGQYIRVKEVDESGAVTATEAVTVPVSTTEDGYTDIAGIRQATDISFERVDNVVTVTVTMQGDNTTISEIVLDENDYPTSITTDGVKCTLSWEGFYA